MDSRWKWIVILSLITSVVWACSRTDEEAPPEQRAKESSPMMEKSAAGQTASAQQDGREQSEATEKTEAGNAEADLGKGEEVYEQSCAACHDQGIAGAPKLTSTADWQQRLQKGMGTLVDHAITGYQGETGMMPAKGGNPALSDYEVEMAVAYMIDEATN